MVRRRFVLAVVCFALGSVVAAQRGGSSVDDFFKDFTTEWIRGNPNLAASTRYFTGDEQDRFEREITPETLEYRQTRIALARKGLASLAKFNREAMTPSQRVSADVMRWQLDMVVRAEPFLDFQFPLEQFGGTNVTLPALLTVNHPL